MERFTEWFEKMIEYAITVGYILSGISAVIAFILFITGGGREALRKPRGKWIGIFSGLALLILGIVFVARSQGY